MEPRRTIKAASSVAAAGDINGDGLDDLVISTPFADPDPMRADAGSSYVVFGRSSGFDSSMDLSSLDGSTGFRLDGAAVDDYSGWSVAAAGDINGDGLGDLIVGAPGVPNGGSSYVVFGRSTGFASVINLSMLGSTGFRLDGAAGDYSGQSVAAAGDINGDGLDDLIIGAWIAAPNFMTRAGSSYVVFGRSTGFASVIALSGLNGSAGFQLDGVAAHDYSGWSVAAAGDINGDGLDDLIIGAPRANPDAVPSDAGSSYVVFGHSTGFGSAMALASLDGSTGFRLDGAVAVDSSGRSVAAAGDINGDGLGDLVIGAPFADPNGLESGSSYVLFGRSTGFDSTIDLSTLAGSIGFQLGGAAMRDYSGFSVAAAGDINGDGLDDLVIGAPGADPDPMRLNAGSSYVLFGRNTTLPGSAAFPSVMYLAQLGNAGLQLDGAVVGDFSGSSVAAAGDINGDGVDDLIVGAPYTDLDATRINAGSTYVVFLSIFRDGFEN